jgi:solute carrier family 25 (mitochondrial 2-oxodicarboxylate transporter), member 21
MCKFYPLVRSLSIKCAIFCLQDPALEFIRKLFLGFVSGTLASCFNIPFDVAKSRIQGPQPEGGVKYRSTVATMRLVVAEEGWRALYKGLVPKVMRLGPGGAVMLLVYEHAYAYLQARFPL